MFAPEGYRMIAVAVVTAVVLAGIGAAIGTPWLYVFFAVGFGLCGFTLWFFRDPDRHPPAEALTGAAIVSPADGQVISIEEVEDPLYIKGPARKISIFLSPIDVHVNRIPANGVIEYEEYVPGDYLVAWHPKASELNERSMLGLRHESGMKILFKQIAGMVARRVVYYAKKGDHVTAGQRYGIVMFGSRMDVLFSPGVEIAVQEKEQVFGGTSILARIPMHIASTSARHVETNAPHERT